jgi:LysR family nitrogen assimilation transcriptional regulator
MDLSRFASFIKIVDVGSLSRAAEQLGVTQPGLSQQIAALEADIGAQLLLRGRQGVSATVAGRILYRHAQMILRQLDDAKTAVQATGAQVAGHVSVGMPRSISTMTTVPLLVELRRRYPDVSIRVTENAGAQLAELMMNGRLDIAILPMALDSGQFTCRPLIFEKYFLVEKDDGEGDTQSTATMAEVSRVPLMITSRSHPVRKFIDESFAAAGLVPNVTLECDSLQETLAIVANGGVATLLPWASARRFAGLLKRRRVVDNELLWGSGLCFSDGLTLSRAANHVCDLIEEVVNGELAAGGWPGAVPAQTPTANAEPVIGSDDQ